MIITPPRNSALIQPDASDYVVRRIAAIEARERKQFINERKSRDAERDKARARDSEQLKLLKATGLNLGVLEKQEQIASARMHDPSKPLEGRSGRKRKPGAREPSAPRFLLEQARNLRPREGGMVAHPVSVVADPNRPQDSEYWWGSAPAGAWNSDPVVQHPAAWAKGEGLNWGGVWPVTNAARWSFFVVVPETRTYTFLPLVLYRGDYAVEAHDGVFTSKYAHVLHGVIWLNVWQSDELGGEHDLTAGEWYGWGDDNIDSTGEMNLDVQLPLICPMEANKGAVVTLWASFSTGALGSGSYALLDYGHFSGDPFKFIACPYMHIY